MTETDTLEPCPLNPKHGSPLIRSTPGDERNGYAETVTIECPVCKVSISRADELPGKSPFYAKGGTGWANAVAAWNIRAALRVPTTEGEG